MGFYTCAELKELCRKHGILSNRRSKQQMIDALWEKGVLEKGVLEEKGLTIL